MSNLDSMTAPEAQPATTGARAISAVDFRAAWRWFGAWAFPFSLVLYLALSGGGYDAVIRGEVGIVVWWALLLGAAAGAFPRRDVFRGQTLVAVGLFAAFTAWTAAGLLWTDSAEATLIEVGRVSTLLGIFVLALALQGRDGLRRTTGAVATAIVFIGGFALLSRIHPSWFPDHTTARFLPSVADRLSDPLDYWNGLAAFMAIGAPLLLSQAMVARRTTFRALAAGAIPLLALVAFLTLSRGGAIAFAVGVLAFFALSPRRLATLPFILLASVGSAILIVAANQRDAFVHALSGSTATSQANEMLWMTIIVVAGVALTSAAVSLAVEHGVVRGPSVRRRPAAAAAARGARHCRRGLHRRWRPRLRLRQMGRVQGAAV